MRSQKGFTLVELMVVITILGILITLAVTNMGPVRTRAKETQVIAAMKDIVRALENYRMTHNGYPGIALPKCDDDGFAPFDDQSGSTPLRTMRGIIGGGIVPHDPAQVSYFDGFYFTPDPSIVGMAQIPDRLVSNGSLEIYPTNPFKSNVAGFTNKEVPMVNIFGIEFENQVVDPLDPLGFHLSYPFFYQNANPGVYNFPSAGSYSGVGDFDMWYMGDWRGAVWGAVYNADTTQADYVVSPGDLGKFFPEGDFAYIPLDPIQTDPGNDQFMRTCKNYWIVVYGSRKTAQQNKYADVWPDFPYPLGNSLHDPADPASTMNEFEACVKAALTGALEVYGTAYTEQLNVAGSN